MGKGTLRVASVVTASVTIVMLVAAGSVRGQQPVEARILDTRTPITYFIADGAVRTGFRPGDRQLAQWAFEAWQRSSEQRLRFEPGLEANALVRLYWAESNEGQYGEMRPLVVAGRRGAAVYIRPDVDALGDDISRRARADSLLRDTIVYLTCVHELGHALGLTHTSDFRDIMYYFGFGGDIVEYFERYRRQLRSTKDIAGLAGVSEGDVRRLRAMYAAR
jgi:hypothetical protein